MTYQQLETQIRDLLGDCALDEWIIDCGNDVLSKIIAFNSFTDIHLTTLSDEDTLSSFLVVEKHLRNSDKTISPIDRIKGVVKNTWNEMWNSPLTAIDGVKSFSRIMTADSIKYENAKISGTPFYRSLGAINDVEVDKYISEFIGYLKNGIVVPFKCKNEIVWLADTDEIQAFTSFFPSCNEARDIIGLYFGINDYLVEFRFQNVNFFEPRKPTVFHSEFGPHWRPSYSDNGWGITLNLSNHSDGVREAVRKSSDWPSSKITDFNKLGRCDTEVSYDDWDIYFEKRVKDFRLWANKDSSILNDLIYFLNKIN